MVKRNYFYKTLIIATVLIFIFSLYNIVNGVEFNDDIQKVELNYYYYEGFGEDKVVQSIKDRSWHILKPDGSLINLKGNYLAFAGIEGKNLNFDNDYYRFVIGNESYDIDYSTRFIYVDKNGMECFVEDAKETLMSLSIVITIVVIIYGIVQVVHLNSSLKVGMNKIIYFLLKRNDKSVTMLLKGDDYHEKNYNFKFKS